MSQAVPSQSTASTFYQKTARPNASKAVLSQSTARPYFPRPVFSTSTGRPYYPRMDNVRPRASSSSPPTGFFNTRTVDRPKSPKPIIKSKWVKKESTAGTQAVLPQTKGEKGSVIEGTKDLLIIDSGCSGSMTGDKDKLSDFKDYKGGYVAFGNDPKGGRITGKGTIMDFERRFDAILKGRGAYTGTGEWDYDTYVGRTKLTSPEERLQSEGVSKLQRLVEVKGNKKKVCLEDSIDLITNQDEDTTACASASVTVSSIRSFKMKKKSLKLSKLNIKLGEDC
ncbi:hypothetical protein Tco_0582781 [Tanacetum coccineum]